MQLILNSMSARPFFPHAWLSYLVILAWGALSLTLFDQGGGIELSGRRSVPCKHEKRIKTIS
jgi:hypothetical protein